jgi:hypothetical protein
MNSIPTDGYALPNDANHPSLPFTPRLLETRGNEAPTLLNDLLSNNLFAFGDFNVDDDVISTPHHSTLPRHVNPLVRRRLFNIRRRRHIWQGTIPQGSPSQPAFGAPPQANILATVAPQLPVDRLDDAYTFDTHPSSSLSDSLSSPMFDNGYHVGAGVLTPQSASFIGFPQSNTHSPIAPQLAVDVFDGRSDPITHPWASYPSSSSSAVLDSGRQLSLSGIQNIPMMPVMAPALASSSSLTRTTSMSPTPEPLVRPWDASAALMGLAASAAASTSMRAEPREPRRGPVSRCSCCKRFQPLVRVDDDIKWVRPDVMKMTLWFNWSSNADAEAQESWEPRGA